MARPKRSQAERERDLVIISRLYLKGRTQAEIAEEIGVSRTQIAYDLRTIRSQWQKETVHNLDEAKNRELERIDLLERTRWETWDQSADMRALDGVQWCVEQRCKILGLYATVRVQNELSGKNGEPIQAETRAEVKLGLNNDGLEGIMSILGDIGIVPTTEGRPEGEIEDRDRSDS